jgi:hypothetical protein
LDNGSEVQDPVVQKLNFDEVRFFWGGSTYTDGMQL